MELGSITHLGSPGPRTIDLQGAPSGANPGSRVRGSISTMSPHRLDQGRVDRLAAVLERTFDQRSAVGGIELVRAPGRVNLIGDHTDYNDGFVLPAAVELDCWLAFRRRKDGLVRVVSTRFDRGGSFWIDDVEPAMTAGPGPARPPNPEWVRYVEAVAWSLRESGLPLQGIDGVVDSSLPMGVGLGSSAALELACALALIGGEHVVAAPILAAVSHRAEREYAGFDSAGIADQFAGAAGREGKALLLDCRTLETKQVTLPHGLRVVVCDTGARVARDNPVLKERRAECARAVALLSERVVGLCSLRDLDIGSLRRHRARLPDAVLRRAEHVIGENARVLDAAVALGSSDLDMIGRLFAQSHASLRDLFEVGSPAVEAMIEIAAGVPGVVASRMTGPGLGGCTVHLVLEDAIPAFAAAVLDRYSAITGLEPHMYPLATADGASRLIGAF
jgi:galactokinase